jgi:hypothetical protein
MATNGSFSYSEVMKMELSEFKDVVLEIQIMNSAQRFEQQRIENHAKAVR